MFHYWWQKINCMFQVKLKSNHGAGIESNRIGIKTLKCLTLCCISGDPLYVGFDLTIASFDSISEVSMVSVL